MASDDSEAFAEEDARVLHDALTGLTAEHREVLVLRFLEDMSYEDVASVIGCELGTIKSRIYYAKRGVAQDLREDTDP